MMKSKIFFVIAGLVMGSASWAVAGEESPGKAGEQTRVTCQATNVDQKVKKDAEGRTSSKSGEDSKTSASGAR